MGIGNIDLSGNSQKTGAVSGGRALSANYPDSQVIAEFQSQLQKPSPPVAAEATQNEAGSVKLEPGDYQRLIALSPEQLESSPDLELKKWMLAVTIKWICMNLFTNSIKIDTSGL